MIGSRLTQVFVGVLFLDVVVQCACYFKIGSGYFSLGLIDVGSNKFVLQNEATLEKNFGWAWSI